MSAALSGMQSALEMAGGSVGFTALFLAGLLSLWYGKYEDREESGYLFWYAIIMLAIVINPLYLSFIRRFSPSLAFDNIFLWIMPTVPVVVCCGVRAVGFLENMRKKAMFTVGLIGLLVLAGATSYSMSAVYLKQESALDNKKQEVLDYLGEYMDSSNKQSCVIWGEDTIMESAREYDGRILLVYGKDMWIDDCFALTGNVYEDEKYNAYQMINEESPSISMLYDEAKMLGCDFFILSTQRYTKALERKEFEKQQIISELLSRRKYGRFSRGFIFGSDEVFYKDSDPVYEPVFETSGFVIFEVTE